jgi:hypothetical protein
MPPLVHNRGPGWLGARLTRRRHLRRAADRRLAQTVTERRRPKRMAASRRLAPRPAVAAAVVAAPVAASGLSEFATRWMFGDGVAEGVPFAGGAGAEYDRPSFLEAPAEAAAVAPRPAIARGTELRSAVEEVGPRFRLSRTPPPAPAPAPAQEPDAPDPAHEEAVRYHAAHEAERTAPAAPRPVVHVIREPGPPRRSQVVVRHIHEGAREAAEGGGGKGVAAYRAARVGIGAARVVQHYEEVKEVEALGHRVADAARGEWSKLKKDAGEWRDRAVHEYDHLKHEALGVRDRVVGEAHHLEREGRALRSRAWGEAHHLEREGRSLRSRAWSEAHHLEREPGQLLRQAEGAERGMLRSAARLVRPLARATTGLVRTATRDVRRVGAFEHEVAHGIEGAEHRLEGALRDPEKELANLGKRLEKQVLDRPVVRRAEAALKGAERAAGRDLRTAERDVRGAHVPAIPGAAAAKAAALAAAAEVPLELSRAGRAVVQFEKSAAGAAHRLEADARHALASADGHMPHVPHVPHMPDRSAVAAPAAAAERAATAAERGVQDAAHEVMYEQVVDRLRRDLLAERERMGNLLGEWP